jgi:hypothetical protein
MDCFSISLKENEEKVSFFIGLGLLDEDFKDSDLLRLCYMFKSITNQGELWLKNTMNEKDKNKRSEIRVSGKLTRSLVINASAENVWTTLKGFWWK